MAETQSIEDILRARRPESQQGKGGVFNIDEVPDKYWEWLREHDKHNHAGMCSAQSLALQKAFPELLRVRGYVRFDHHWWCETPDGIIVDPTWKQFRGYAYTYQAYDESQPEPIGQCFECGALLYEEGAYGLNYRGDGLCRICSEYYHDFKKYPVVYNNEHKFEFNPNYTWKNPGADERNPEDEASNTACNN
jgi:hypothetical protein